jgi:cytochrome c oxidase accessory protein FixG
MSAPVATERVLATLNADGTRRWLRPRPTHGGFWEKRRVVAWTLITIFLSLPHLRIAGKPAILLDLPRREFTLFGTTFLPTDTLLLMLLGVSILIGIFLATALFGRVWCGWACPQTVYMEFLFRPIERWIEGGWNQSRQLDRERSHFHPRRLAKYAVYAVLAAILGNSFLAYFVGTDALAHWMRSSPAEHPGPFLVMAVTSAMVFFDFTWFREQTCLVACPYGRWQSVLLDRQSMIVAYDRTRGEPRGHGVGARPGLGDCVDCNACVLTCPTGIDIRDGLQMECIHCTQCADACDAVMVKVGKPVGLVRYASQESLAGHKRRLLRPRTVLYPAAFTLFFGGFLVALSTRDAADVTLLGAIGEPFVREAGDTIVNQVRIRVTNRSRAEARYGLELVGAPEARLIAPELPMTLEPGQSRTTSVFVVAPESSLEDCEGRRTTPATVVLITTHAVEASHDPLGPILAVVRGCSADSDRGGAGGHALRGDARFGVCSRAGLLPEGGRVGLNHGRQRAQRSPGLEGRGDACAHRRRRQTRHSDRGRGRIGAAWRERPRGRTAQPRRRPPDHHHPPRVLCRFVCGHAAGGAARTLGDPHRCRQWRRTFQYRATRGTRPVTALLLSVLGASLAGSAHCAAMCGPFACAASSGGGTSSERRWAGIAYQSGRLASYMLVGAVAGGLGQRLDASIAWTNFGRPAALLAGVTLVIWGAARLLSFAGMELPSIVQAAEPNFARRALHRAGNRSTQERAALLGLLTPLLPCGWLYAFVAPALASGSALGGAAVMAVFWAGGVPALAILALGAQRLTGPVRRYLPLIAATALIVVGGVTLARAVRATVPAVHRHVDTR